MTVFDVRRKRVHEPSAELKSRIESLVSSTRGFADNEKYKMRVQYSSLTGNPSRLFVGATPLVSFAKERDVDDVTKAINYLRSASETLGFTKTTPLEVVPDPHTLPTSSGARAVHLHQSYRGIPVFQMVRTVDFSPNSEIRSVSGDTVTLDKRLDTNPSLHVEEAFKIAAKHATLQSKDVMDHEHFSQAKPIRARDFEVFDPKIIASFGNLPSQPTVFDAGLFGQPTKASLTIFPEANRSVLAWEFIITMPDFQGQYQIILDAKKGKILYCRQLFESVKAMAYVFPKNPSTGMKKVVFKTNWVEKDETIGNNVEARFYPARRVARGKTIGGVVKFNPGSASQDQITLNAFYFINMMHEFLYGLGFTEEAGNFQQDNCGKGGVEGDRVICRIYDMKIDGTANFGTYPDGTSPIMNLGTEGSRSTALDLDVVAHEYCHGLSKRLVGGPMNVNVLDGPQSKGMGEGWSDFFACVVTNDPVVGEWVANSKNGIRNAPYDKYPYTFAQLSRSSFNCDEHNVGEIWAAALWELKTRITAKKAAQLVIDAMKLSPANTHMLDMRDMILQAEDDSDDSNSEKQKIKEEIWASFAKYGMGAGASSPRGDSFYRLTGDFTP